MGTHTINNKREIDQLEIVQYMDAMFVTNRQRNTSNVGEML